MKATSALTRSLTALPLLFMLGVIAFSRPEKDQGCCLAAPPAVFSRAAVDCDGTPRRVQLLVAWMPADLPPRLRRAGNGCPL